MASLGQPHWETVSPHMRHIIEFVGSRPFADRRMWRGLLSKIILSGKGDESAVPGLNNRKVNVSGVKEEGKLRIAVVGVCAAGKSSLVEALRAAGYQVRHVAQEHSYVPHMWRQMSRPDILIYIDADYDAIQRRRPTSTFRPADLAEQKRRLAHARQHCDLYLDTSDMTPAEVRQVVWQFLQERGNG